MGYLIKDGQAVESSLIMCAGVGTQIGKGSGASWNNKGKCPVCGKTVSCNSSTGRLKPHGTRRRVTSSQEPGIITLDLTKRQADELQVVEGDTAQEDSSDEHKAFAEALATGTKLENGKWRILVSLDVLVYLAENLHYHVDRLQDMVGGTNPNYDWESWSSLGADLAAIQGLDTRVKNMLKKMGVPYRVWSFSQGMHYPKAQA